MTTTYIEPPPRRNGMGCFGKGCLILVGFAIFLVIAFATGGYFALRHIRTTYLPSSGPTLSPVTSSEIDADEVRQRWETFEREAQDGHQASIVLSEAEVNTLLDSYPDTRGKYRVTLEADSARVRLTMPILNVRFLKGRYLNAECVLQTSVDRDPRHAKIREIKINDQSVPDEILDWNYGAHSIHGLIGEFLDQNNLTSVGIADGKITAECQGADATD